MCLSSGMPPWGPPDSQHRARTSSLAAPLPPSSCGRRLAKGGMGARRLDAVCDHTQQPDGFCSFFGNQTGPFLSTEPPVFLPLLLRAALREAGQKVRGCRGA